MPTHSCDSVVRHLFGTVSSSVLAADSARYVWSCVRLALRALTPLVADMLTDHAAVDHERPPLPVDVDASIVMSPHVLTSAAPTYTTAGVSGVSGEPSALGPDSLAYGQQLQSVYAQYGLRTPPSAVTLSPAQRRSSPNRGQQQRQAFEAAETCAPRVTHARAMRQDDRE